MKICSSCHTLIADDVAVCPNCGAAQRHFPEKVDKKRKKPIHRALGFIVPAVLVVGLVCAVLAFALRESESQTTTPTLADTEPTTTEMPFTLTDSGQGEIKSGAIVCENGEGVYIYDPAKERLLLRGAGVLSLDLSGNDHVPWQDYLNHASDLEIEAFSEIAPETFRSAPNLVSLTVNPTGSDVYIGEGAFADCKSLRYVTFYENADSLSSQPNEIWTVQLGDRCFSGCTALEMLQATSVSEIGADVLDGVEQLIFSQHLVRLDSEFSCDELLLMVDEGEAVRGDIWEKLLQIDPEPLVFVGNLPLDDCNDCPITDE